MAENMFNNLLGGVADVGYQAYQEQINQVRKTLLGGAQDGPKMDAKTQEYFLKVKALGLLYIGAENVQATLLDKKTNKYYKNVDEYRSKIMQQSGLAGGATEPTTNSDFVGQQQPKIDVPDNITQLYADNAKTGEATAKHFRDNNSNTWNNTAMPAGHDAFPEPGQDIAGHDGIGDVAASQTSYDIPATGGKPAQKLSKGWSSVPKGTINQTGTPLAPLTERLTEMLEAQRQVTPGSYRFFIEKLHGKSYDGNFFKKGPIKAGLTPKELPNRMVFPAYISKYNDSYDLQWEDYNFIGRGEKVRIYKSTDRSLTLEFNIISDFSSELLMAAIDAASKAKGKQSNDVGNANKNKGTTQTISKKTTDVLKNNVSDKNANISATEEDRLKGIQEVFPDWGDGTTPNATYSGANLAGFIPGQLSGTPEMLYERMTFLSQCCYGWYRKDGKLKEQPFVRVRIGDFFDCVCTINSLNFTEDEFDLDLNPSTVGAVPMIVTVSMNLTIIHEDEPSSEYRRFYHRRDYDKEDLNYTPDSGKATSTFKDGALDANQSKSPLSFKDSLNDYGKGNFNFPNAAIAQQDSLKGQNPNLANLGNSVQDNYQKGFDKYTQGNEFNSSLKDLKGSTGNLNDVKKKERLKNILTNAKRLLEVAQAVDLEQVKDVKEFVPNAKTGTEKTIPSTESLANTPIKSAFKTASVEKPMDVPQKSKAMFPKFKSPSVEPPNPTGGNSASSTV